MSKAVELRQKRKELWEQTKAFLESNRDENDRVKAGALDQYYRMVQDVENMGKEIKALEEQAAIDAEFARATSEPVVTPVSDPKADMAEKKKRYYNAFFEMIRGHEAWPEVRNDLVLTGLNEGDKAAGGYTVPDEFERTLIKKLEEVNVFRRFAHVMTTSGGTTTIPVANDGMTAQWLAEGEAVPETSASFGIVTLGAYKLGTMIKITNELLQDSAFDLPGYISECYGRAMGNAEEIAFLTGDGDGKPTGILNDTVGAGVGKVTAATNAVTFDEILELTYSLKAPYRKKALFMCNEQLVFMLRMLKDKTDRYIWNDGVKEGEPSTLLGTRVETCSNFPVPGRGVKALLYGDLSYYWVADRRARTFRRLNELYAPTGQVGFMTTQRVDGKLVLPEAVKVLQFKS